VSLAAVSRSVADAEARAAATPSSIDQEDAVSTDAEEVVNRFLAAWQSDDVEKVLAFFADDAVWHNMPMDPVVGIEAIREVYVQFAGAMDGLRVDVHLQLSDGTFVMHERTDHVSMDGKAISLPICGVFEIQDGRIKSWRDYFDMAGLTGS
jgi:limonene-1,2-epoxide hydrolase